MAGGYTGKILFVDLTTGKLTTETPDEKLYRDFIGGYGVGARIVFSRQRPGVDPLGPENMLGFMTGPLTGTDYPYGTRYTVIVGRSPLTRGWGDANSGGDFGPGLKCCSFATPGCDQSIGNTHSKIAQYDHSFITIWIPASLS